MAKYTRIVQKGIDYLGKIDYNYCYPKEIYRNIGLNYMVIFTKV